MSTIVPLLAIVGTVCLFAWAVYTNHRKRRLQEQRQQMLKDPSSVQAWMKTEGFEPDHFNFHEGSAIGMQEGVPRILLAQASKPKFYALQDLRSVESRVIVTSPRPLGAAPGVVETREFRHYSLKIHFSDENKRIFLESEEQMDAWETRLNKLITAQKS